MTRYDLLAMWIFHYERIIDWICSVCLSILNRNAIRILIVQEFELRFSFEGKKKKIPNGKKLVFSTWK
jgi:hypothetical protein